jgi:hypothetical protein
MSDEIEKAAYLMVASYGVRGLKRDDSVFSVAHDMPEVSHEILAAMWHAIDAYVDMNGEAL